MLLVYVGLIAVSIGGIGALLAAHCCELGWHPVEGRRMRPGVRVVNRGRATVKVSAAWECGRCHRVIGATVLTVNPSLQRELRAQVGEARAKSKVISLEVVRRERKEVC